MTRRFVGAIPRAKPLLIPAKYLIICASGLTLRLIRFSIVPKLWLGTPSSKLRLENVG